MPLSLFDLAGIALYLVVAVYIYKKAWFFSFYSFVKFLLVLLVSLTAGLNVAQRNFNDIPLTNLQVSLIAQGVVFTILWKIVNFRKIFFATTDSAVSINRFIFFHHIDRVIATVPALVVSFFVCFFLFTTLVTASTSYPTLASAIESSRIVRPISYQVYFAKVFNGKLFEGVAFKLPNPVSTNNPSGGSGQDPSIGTSPIPNTPGGSETFIPPTQAPAPDSNGSKTTFVPPPVRRDFTPTPRQSSSQIPQQNTIVTPKTNSGQSPVFPTPTPTTRPNTQQVFPTATRAPISNPTSIPTAIPTSRPDPPSVSTSQVEQDIHRKTNEERAKVGLRPLALDSALSAVARAHSQDMSNRNFFSHINPDGKSPFDRIKAAGISYFTAAENIAGAANADIIMANWMNSTGHRENILKSSFGKIGVGVAVDSKYGFLATQNFTN